jgi:hypothetical protein
MAARTVRQSTRGSMGLCVPFVAVARRKAVKACLLVYGYRRMVTGNG